MEALHYECLAIAISGSNLSSLKMVKHEVVSVSPAVVLHARCLKLLQELAASQQFAQRVSELLF
jgi:hypothetical protein